MNESNVIDWQSAAATAGIYFNERLASVNDHEVRLSVMSEPYPWHVHPDSDEFFLVLSGELEIELPERRVVLRAGQMFSVPRGLRHRTRPIGPRSVNLTVERRDSASVQVPE